MDRQSNQSSSGAEEAAYLDRLRELSRALGALGRPTTYLTHKRPFRVVLMDGDFNPMAAHPGYREAIKDLETRLQELQLERTGG